MKSLSLLQKKRQMEKNVKTIGQMILAEVEKQGKTIACFAKEINCSPNHAYKIFKKNTLDIDLVRRASKVLNHNFFADIAENYGLASTPDVLRQFYDMVPPILKKIGIDGVLVTGVQEEEEDIPLPDITLSALYMVFTIDETFEERVIKLCPDDSYKQIMNFRNFTDDKGNSVLLVNIYNLHIKQYTQMCNIKIEYKTEQEWEDILRLALKVIEENYTKETWGELKWLNDMSKIDDIYKSLIK